MTTTSAGQTASGLEAGIHEILAGEPYSSWPVSTLPGTKIFNWRRVRAVVVHDYKATRSPGHAAVPCSGRLADWAVIKKCWTQRRRWGCPRRLARASGAGYPARRAGQR